ncbi:TolC family protein, partial [bacterium]|nr:TolC family protein [bacterium]
MPTAARALASASRRIAPAVAFVLAAALVVAPARAADGAPRRITFAEATSIALEENLTLLLAERRRDLDETAVSDARARFLPDLQLSLSANESFDRVAAGGGTEWTSSRSMSAGLSSGLTLFDGFANVSGLRQARFEQVAGRLDYERARQTVVFQLITDYLALIEATEQERVRTENLAAQEEQLDRVRALVEEGERPISDLFQQQATVSSAKLSLVEARRTRELGQVDLMQTLHLDPRGEVEFVIPEPAELDPGEAT